MTERPVPPDSDMRGFLLTVRRALLMVVAYIDVTCRVGDGKRRD